MFKREKEVENSEIMSGFLIPNLEHFTLKLTELEYFEKSKMAVIHLKLKVRGIKVKKVPELPEYYTWVPE